MMGIDLREIYDQLPFRDKFNLFLRANHYLFWKITLMDVTIVLPTFALLVCAFGKFTQWPSGHVIFASLAVCSVIEYLRIRFRRVKTMRLVSKKAEYAQALFERYSELVERSGTDEDRRNLRVLAGKMRQARELVDEMADLVYQEDVLGLGNDDGTNE